MHTAFADATPRALSKAQHRKKLRAVKVQQQTLVWQRKAGDDIALDPPLQLGFCQVGRVK